MKISLIILTLFFTLLPLSAQDSSREPDKETLGKAVEYFGSQKYQEALQPFERLDKEGKLTSRYRAYMAICLFKTGEYEKAANVLQEILPDTENYAPSERTLYIYTCGECYFQRGLYKEALTHYLNALSVCNKETRGDVCYRLGLCNLMYAEYEEAIKYLSEAEKAYKEITPDELQRAHIEQTRRMLKSLLITHGTSRMNGGNEVTGQNEHQDADSKGSTIDQ